MKRKPVSRFGEPMTLLTVRIPVEVRDSLRSYARARHLTLTQAAIVAFAILTKTGDKAPGHGAMASENQ